MIMVLTQGNFLILKNDFLEVWTVPTGCAIVKLLVKDKNGDITKAKNPITLRHLFTMTSGLDYGFDENIIEDIRKATDGKMNTVQAAKHFAKKTLAFEPGTEWLYGVSHDVLAAVIEIVSGKKYRDYVKENIFMPLDMNDSYFHNEAVRDRMSELYRYVNNECDDIVKLQLMNDNEKEGKIVQEKRMLSIFSEVNMTAAERE
jgi:CubicO group peptidase (beta-lactamase class C family)